MTTKCLDTEWMAIVLVTEGSSGPPLPCKEALGRAGELLRGAAGWPKQQICISQLSVPPSPQSAGWRLALCCSAAKSCLSLCDPMDCSMPGSSVLHCLLEFSQIHLHWGSDAIQHLILCCPLLPLASIFPSIRVLSSECSSHQVAKN